MSQIIKANFSNVDSAAFAINDVRERFDEGVIDAKLKYHDRKRGKTDLSPSEYFTPTDIYNPVLLNGIMPVALSNTVIELSGSKKEVFEVPKKASVEIVANDDVTEKVCNTLRHDGGFSVTVK